MICSRCGTRIINSADAFCSVCGATVAGPGYQQAPPRSSPERAPHGYAAVPSAMPPKKKRSALPAVLIILLAAAALAALWYFVLRDKGQDGKEPPPGAISSPDIGDDDVQPPRAARETGKASAREPGEGIRLPGIFGGARDDAPPEDAAEPEPTAVEYPAPVFPYADASGVTDSPTGRDYSPEKVVDGRPDTAWNVPGTGGEWIILFSDTEQYVSGIRILNGYTKYSPEYETWLYYRNHRPKDIIIIFSDGTYIETTLRDVFDEDNYIYQDIPFDSPKLMSSVMIHIENVYEGDRWDDTCISEIEFY